MVNAVAVNSRYRAFSLIETLISLSLAIVLLFSVASFYSDSYYNQYKQRELLNLQRNAHQLLDYFQQHIQHIGFQGKFRQESNYSLFRVEGKFYALNFPQCLMFFYDLNGDGCIGNRTRTQPCHNAQLNRTSHVSKELWGIKLENKAIAIYEDSAEQNCYKTECEKVLTSCHSGVWRRFSEMADYTVEDLHFEWIAFERILKISLTLASETRPDIQYSASAYSYLFNGRDW
ncbi:hypothetical protein [Glaesserella sp.]|uniref:hypothetical protein n=1 Tax=Glaesserella sp. TaxID=2094731 RepID=UPI0035A17343